MSINFENSRINPLYNNLYIVDTEIKLEIDSEIDSETETDIGEAECRICLENNSEEELISICGCKGSIKYVHKSCIESWINSFPPNHINHLKCQLCKDHYNFDVLDVNTQIHYNDVNRYYCLLLMIIYFLILFMVLVSLLIITN